MALPAITPSGVGTEVKYPTQSTAGLGISGILSAAPGPVNDPLIWEPGPELTGNQYQVWVITTGAGADWGGAEAHAAILSDPDTSFGYIGTIRKSAVQGVLTATFASGGDPDTSNTLSVDITQSGKGSQLIAGTANDADAYLPLAYVDGELVAYSAATLTSAFNYDLDTYIRRGAFDSTIGSHASGSNFGLAFQAFIHSYPKHLVGTTISFKFCSFNIAGDELEDLSAVTAYPYTLTGAGVEEVETCPTTLVLLGGAAEIEWGSLDSECIVDCADWGHLTDPVDPQCIDMGVLGTETVLSDKIKCRVLTSGASTTLVEATDYLLIVAKTIGSATTVNGPTTPVPDGTRFEIADAGDGGLGDSDSNPITFVPDGGALVAGLSSFVFQSRGGAFAVTWCDDEGQWTVS